MIDGHVLTLLREVDPSSWAAVFLLAVILAPVIYKLRLRFNRWLRRIGWITLGFFLGLAASTFNYTI